MIFLHSPFLNLDLLNEHIVIKGKKKHKLSKKKEMDPVPHRTPT